MAGDSDRVCVTVRVGLVVEFPPDTERQLAADVAAAMAETLLRSDCHADGEFNDAEVAAVEATVTRVAVRPGGARRSANDWPHPWQATAGDGESPVRGAAL